ncbi:Dph6-related ATP pyrophosphatase [Oceanisphaera arctica]|uniref:ATP-binding protein n=1 Tax=Oceanisphaera arctica TaxID=641510 RepID=A0A2P5TQP7_9GAMM|nr:ATP-binding protein [Oceanisphaera arctica]PPL18086.1 ATP-binding protein [Oceanisphaera arctica]GHA09715.1 ATPase [Oceanisphaera arctica]
MTRKTLMSWSSGKDSAWALHTLQQDPEFEVVGLFTTVNEEFQRVAMHGVRAELLHRQADSIGLPLEIIYIPFPCSNEQYAARMAAFVDSAKARGIACFGFGDLLLEDVRQYREQQLLGTGIEAVFPIWGTTTDTLPGKMFASGLRTVITCLDPKKVPEHLAGQELSPALLAELPEGTDHCGENGEFHSFAFDGPMFRHKIDIRIGDIVHRDGYVFTDVLPVHG